jgi:Putative auto-transporter adhesin, head GIN domain
MTSSAPLSVKTLGSKSLFKLLLLLAVPLMAVGCDDFSPGIRGSGKVVSETRNPTGFSAIVLKGTGRVLIDTNGSESLEITADDNLLPLLTSEIQGDQLVLGTKDNTNVSPSNEIVYKVSAKNLNSIELSGSGSIDSKGTKADVLIIVIGGSGDVSAAGTAERQEITVAGSGNYKGDNLKSKSTVITISGSGNVDVDTSEKLDVTIAGSGSINYRGNPAITQKVLGSGSIQKK